MWNRIKELIYKFISVKGVMVVAATTVFCIQQTELSFYLCLASWGIFVGAREVFKIVSLIKEVKNGYEAYTNIWI